MPVFAQVPVTNANSFDLDNGADAFLIFVATTTPTTGNTAGTGVVNTTINDQMLWTIIPREYMTSSNGTAPGTMELVSQETSLAHSFFGSGGGTGTPSIIWDQTITPVTYLNPVSGSGPDGRRYPDLSVAPLVTIVGGASGLPAPAGCAFPQYWVYTIGFEYATATPGTGITVPADGLTDLAWCFWSPGGMTATPADPSGCEVGGNLSMMSLISTNERVPLNVTSGAATPLPTGVSRNPLSGTRAITTAVPSNFNNRPNTQMFFNWPGFREPTIQFRLNSTTGGTPPFTGPESGSGALWMDATGLLSVEPIMRTCASGHLGQLVVHILESDPINFTPPAQPGFPVTPTSNLMINPADPLFLFLTPIFDGFLGANTIDYAFAQKDTYDTPNGIAIAGPIGLPGITFGVQSFVIDFLPSPPNVISTNKAIGNVR
jgi:hypothetical protein